MYKLAFTTIIKNEAKYIEEWILFHQLVGVEKFYIYDNGSTDGVYDILKKYIEIGLVEYKYLPGKMKQLVAYNHSLYVNRYKTKYMGFIDADEFVIPNIGELPDLVDKLISKYNASGIAINWRMYGSSNHYNKKNGLVIENYRYRSLDNFEPNKHIKTICNPRKVLFVRNPHFPIYFKGYSIDENGHKVSGPFNEGGSCDILRINHYFTKSKEDYICKMNRGKADCFSKRDMSDFYKHDKNDLYDYNLEKYVGQLEEKIGQKYKTLCKK